VTRFLVHLKKFGPTWYFQLQFFSENFKSLKAYISNSTYIYEVAKKSPQQQFEGNMLTSYRGQWYKRTQLTIGAQD
jgi:hypothetical protein